MRNSCLIESTDATSIALLQILSFHVNSTIV
jgi:hypothetical protein